MAMLNMARIGNRVLLGYEDELISDKYKDQVDYVVNKIGGKPDWPGDAPTSVTCKLCGLNLPLILQIYAPLDYSSYHRTLYIFACINPNCWNQNGSWVCLRSQIRIDSSRESLQGGEDDSVNNAVENDWHIAGADAWADEENGNTIEAVWSKSDADLSRNLAMLTVSDECNANSAGSVGAEGAIGVVPTATAMIEGDEGEVVSIDTPTAPQVNLIAMLEEAAPMPQVPISSLQFTSYFISVGEEELSSAMSPTNSEHIKDVLKDYQTKISDDDMLFNKSSMDKGDSDIAGVGVEHYEKTLPRHGDKLFYQFITRIQANPGHILRYGGYPLFLYPLQEKLRSCRHCGAELLFELQVLPTLIPRLTLVGSDRGTHLEFGTVFLYSCAVSCWEDNDSYREEHLIVQMEKM
ncbi:programmed cell death protein 2-like [Rhodnius prolixus]